MPKTLAADRSLATEVASGRRRPMLGFTKGSATETCGHNSGDMHTSRIECEAYVGIIMVEYPTTVPTKDGRASASAADDRRKEG